MERSNEKLETRNFASFNGTVSSVIKSEDNVYIISQCEPLGSPAMPIGKKDYTDISLIKYEDFFSNGVNIEKVQRVNGKIMTAALSKSLNGLYFAVQRQEEHEFVSKELFCEFSINSGDVADVGIYPTLGHGLYNVDDKYFIEQGQMYATISADTGKTWIPVMPEVTGERSVFSRDGDIYYMINGTISLLTKESIINNDFSGKILAHVNDSAKPKKIFVDNERNIYATISRDNIPYMLNVETGTESKILESSMFSKYLTIRPIYKQGNDFYYIVWPADSPSSTKSKIVKSDGNSIEETKIFKRNPDFLGALGDYLMFNLDDFSEKKCHLFGIKYK